MREWKMGDVVVLMSGGPRMTITSIQTNGIIHCMWFTEGGLKYGQFPKLTLYKPNKINRRKCYE